MIVLTSIGFCHRHRLPSRSRDTEQRTAVGAKLGLCGRGGSAEMHDSQRTHSDEKHRSRNPRQPVARTSRAVVDRPYSCIAQRLFDIDPDVGGIAAPLPYILLKTEPQEF